MDIRPRISVLWSDESKFEIFGSNHPVFVIHKVGERMISACVVPTVKHGGGGVMVLCWWHSVIYLEFKVHLTSMAITAFCSDKPSHPGLRLVGLPFVFQQDNDPKHTSRLCKGYFTKKESDGVLHQMTWPPHFSDFNQIEIVFDELDRRVKGKQPTSAQHMCELLQDCWKSIPGEAGWRKH